MERKIYFDLLNWKNSTERKPLILQGARQVGKTYIVNYFAGKEYTGSVYCNFEKDSGLHDFFHDLSPASILRKLSIYKRREIIPGHTLIIFDEIQACPEAITSLKYFNEEANDYHIIALGSLLGVSVNRGNFSFPVGKVQFMTLYPLDFEEYLMARNEHELIGMIRECYRENTPLDGAFHERALDYYKEYLFVGGMPEAVQSFAENKDFNEVREIQKRILAAYEQDFSKHAPNEIVPRLRMLWNSIPSQLAKENKKFIYGLVREGARAKDYETAIMWLSDCGLVHKVSRVNAAGIPLRAYEDLKAFKLFVVDVGLLGCMAGLRQRTLLDGNDLFVEFKGALTEQYVCQQLKTIQNLDVYYYTNDRGSCEVDFVVDTGELIVPVEVKAEVNLRAKSLKTYREKFFPEVSVRTSMADFQKEEGLVNLPLYAIDQITKI